MMPLTQWEPPGVTKKVRFAEKIFIYTQRTQEPYFFGGLYGGSRYVKDIVFGISL